MENKDEESIKLSYPDMLNSILNETINTQAYIRAFAVLSLPKDKINKFEEEFLRQRDGIREQYYPKKQ